MSQPSRHNLGRADPLDMRAFLALTLVVASLGARCKKPKMDDAPDKAAATPPPKPTEVSEAEKTNAYIECSNRFVERAYQARDRYLSWVDAKKGPTGKESVLGTYTLVGDVATE